VPLWWRPLSGQSTTMVPMVPSERLAQCAQLWMKPINVVEESKNDPQSGFGLQVVHATRWVPLCQTGASGVGD
ncbi:unnamed protein product, partial [Amoebophrya sp. A120]